MVRSPTKAQSTRSIWARLQGDKKDGGEIAGRTEHRPASVPFLRTLGMGPTDPVPHEPGPRPRHGDSNRGADDGGVPSLQPQGGQDESAKELGDDNCGQRVQDNTFGRVRSTRPGGDAARGPANRVHHEEGRCHHRQRQNRRGRPCQGTRSFTTHQRAPESNRPEQDARPGAGQQQTVPRDGPPASILTLENVGKRERSRREPEKRNQRDENGGERAVIVPSVGRNGTNISCVLTSTPNTSTNDTARR